MGSCWEEWCVAPKLDFLLLVLFIPMAPCNGLYLHVYRYILATWKCLNRYKFFVCLLLWMAELVRGSILSTGLSCFIKYVFENFSAPEFHIWFAHTIVTCECTHIQLIVFLTQLYYIYLCLYYSVVQTLASCISFRLDLIMRFHFNLSNNILWLYLNGLEYVVFMLYVLCSKYWSNLSERWNTELDMNS